MVATADSNVNPIITQTVTFFEYGICRFQNTRMGTIARMMSVTPVYALTQYMKSRIMALSQHLPGRSWSQSLSTGLHSRKMRIMEIMAKTICTMDRPYRNRLRGTFGSSRLQMRMEMAMLGKLKAPMLKAVGVS